MTTKTTSRELTFEQLMDDLREVGREAAERFGHLFSDDQFRTHLREMGEALEDMWAEAAEQVRKAAEAKPLDEMTVDELHELATERKIPGRSRMHKAELIDALRKG